MLKVKILKNVPKAYQLIQQSLVTEKMNRTCYQRFKMLRRPNNFSLIKKMVESYGHRNSKFQSSFYISGVLGSAAVALVSAVNYAYTKDAGLSDFSISKNLSPASQQQLLEAYETVKREMEYSADKDKFDDLDHLIFVVKIAIATKESKEELMKMRKSEEILLQDSIASDQAMRDRADDLFKRKDKELRAQFRRDFELQASEEERNAKAKCEQMSRDLKHAAAMELEHDLNTQRALMAKELKDKFDTLRTESEILVNDVETTLNAKHADLLAQEAILKENKYLVDLRNSCTEIEFKLTTEMAPGKEWSDQRCSLSPLVEAVLQSFPENDDLAMTVLATLPAQAIERGVFTEVALKKRFEGVEKNAQRLALLHNEGPHSGAMYLLSYLRSMLTFRPSENSTFKPELLQEVDNADILFRASHCVARGDLLGAVKILDRLQGAPRTVVSGWLEEARFLLQVRSSIAVFKNYATLRIQRSANPFAS